MMKFVTFYNPDGHMRAGLLDRDRVIDMNLTSKGVLPDNMEDFIKNNEKYMSTIKKLMDITDLPSFSLEEIRLTAPLPKPASFRDFVAFETHVKNATKRSGDTVAREWYEMPIFYFSNPNAMKGPGEDVKRPSKCMRLDYELELACVIGKEGKNIKSHEAEDYIFGYTILNDWSARDIQMKEMKVLLGPAKGKDFATSIGPYLVTKDELESYRVGDLFDLEMTAAVNSEILSRGNFKDIYYSFGEMIERASEEVILYPGDIIGSGTVGFGCIMEIGPEVHRWLEPGDEVELEITGLGSLKNRIV
ncbi:fumarylacetoacetate hydrolase family protein [Bacillus sp. ISL-46]|uniref:fumarylacetoacetate hydrolase family protein n=1 Tax=Bacillus sp. ISL-46 TaxID=2819129 RepID=UPI001BE93413|nr:fumarylacetoacetate hydrolase family protein [Bacillus sp. ISL-46]MBT2721148.1 fumarylacetoacetate hydrolase family protein [Bacillus sp. ISL-46]